MVDPHEKARKRAEAMDDTELSVQIETNHGQLGLRGIYKDVLAKRLNERQEKVFSAQQRTSDSAARAAWWSAIATGLAAGAALLQVLIAYWAYQKL